MMERIVVHGRLYRVLGEPMEREGRLLCPAYRDDHDFERGPAPLVMIRLPDTAAAEHAAVELRGGKITVIEEESVSPALRQQTSDETPGGGEAPD